MRAEAVPDRPRGLELEAVVAPAAAVGAPVDVEQAVEQARAPAVGVQRDRFGVLVSTGNTSWAIVSVM